MSVVKDDSHSGIHVENAVLLYFNVSHVEDLALSAESRQDAIAVSSDCKVPFFALEHVPRVRHWRSVWPRAIHETLDSIFR